jgi:hypothetical protein
VLFSSFLDPVKLKPKYFPKPILFPFLVIFLRGVTQEACTSTARPRQPPHLLPPYLLIPSLSQIEILLETLAVCPIPLSVAAPSAALQRWFRPSSCSSVARDPFGCVRDLERSPSARISKPEPLHHRQDCDLAARSPWSPSCPTSSPGVVTHPRAKSLRQQPPSDLPVLFLFFSGSFSYRILHPMSPW